MRQMCAASVRGRHARRAPGNCPDPGAPGGPSDSLSAAVGRISGRLDSLEAGLCPTGPIPAPPEPTGEIAGDSLTAELHRLTLRLEALRGSRCPAAAGAAAVQAQDTTDELAGVRAAAQAAAGVPQPHPQVAAGDSASPVPPATTPGAKNANLLNPEISATGDIRLVARDESPQRDNGVAREFEFSFQSALDPYSKTKIFLTFEDEVFGVEEGYIYWSGLPGRIRADLGLFRQQVGDLNRWHLHALPEGEYPLVYQRFLGADGLSGVGVSLYTALPMSLGRGTHEVTLQATTAASDPLYAGGRQPTLLGRLQNFWQLSRATYAQSASPPPAATTAMRRFGAGWSGSISG